MDLASSKLSQDAVTPARL